MKYTLTKKAIEWIVGKLKANASDISDTRSELEELKKMVIQNQYYAPLIIDDEDHTLLVDDNTILLADWKYKEQ